MVFFGRSVPKHSPLRIKKRAQNLVGAGAIGRTWVNSKMKGDQGKGVKIEFLE